MPVRRVTRKSCKSKCKRKVRGGSLFSWIKNKALPWAKKNRIISRGARGLKALGVNHPYIETVGRVAGTLGYGLNGGSLNRTGRGRKTYRRQKKRLR